MLISKMSAISCGKGDEGRLNRFTKRPTPTSQLRQGRHRQDRHQQDQLRQDRHRQDLLQQTQPRHFKQNLQLNVKLTSLQLKF